MFIEICEDSTTVNANFHLGAFKRLQILAETESEWYNMRNFCGNSSQFSKTIFALVMDLPNCNDIANVSEDTRVQIYFPSRNHSQTNGWCTIKEVHDLNPMLATLKNVRKFVGFISRMSIVLSL